MEAHRVSRYCGWLPSRAAHDAFIDHLQTRCRTPYATGAKHEPPVAAFQQAIQASPTMVKLFENIFLQAGPENKISDFEHFLHHLDLVIVAPPKFVTVPGQPDEPIGVPMYLLFDLLCNTSAAYDLFRMPEFNKALKQLLQSWGHYLTLSDSSKTLTNEPGGWFTDTAIDSLQANDRGIFNETYVVPDSDAVNRGYNSWDDFFTREIKHKARPVVPDQGKAVIYNACESTVELIQRNVQSKDKFWLKSKTPYSLYDIFDGDNDTAQNFVGGTVYQAFLSPQDYHRWHSPVTGTVVDARVVEGTYYAALPDEGDPHTNNPRGAIIRSQPWLTMASTRAIITIQADNPEIGLVAFIGVGMAEVSTCELLVQKGHRVEPGRQIGMFHFGGSSHALIFGPQANVTFADGVEEGKHLHVNRIIGGVNQ